MGGSWGLGLEAALLSRCPKAMASGSRGEAAHPGDLQIWGTRGRGRMERVGEAPQRRQACVVAELS